MRVRASVLMCAVAIGLAACSGTPDRRPAATPAGEAKARAAQAAAEADPSDPTGWAAAIRAWITSAASEDRFDPATGEYSPKGEEDLRRAVAAWERYVAFDDPDRRRRGSTASRMVPAFVALDDLAQAAGAQEIVAEIRGGHGAYAQLAVLAYQAGQTRKGDLAAARSIQLAPRNQRRALEGSLEAAKKDAALLQG